MSGSDCWRSPHARGRPPAGVPGRMTDPGDTAASVGAHSDAGRLETVREAVRTGPRSGPADTESRGRTAREGPGDPRLLGARGPASGGRYASPIDAPNRADRSRASQDGARQEVAVSCHVPRPHGGRLLRCFRSRNRPPRRAPHLRADAARTTIRARPMPGRPAVALRPGGLLAVQLLTQLPAVRAGADTSSTLRVQRGQRRVDRTPRGWPPWKSARDRFREFVSRPGPASRCRWNATGHGRRARPAGPRRGARPRG